MSALNTSQHSERDLHLIKRRNYYQKNWDHIRQRDNAAAAKKRKENPEKYRSYHRAYTARIKASAKEQKALADNPDFLGIVSAIMMEDEESQ